jgi:hypothetical protein
MITKNQFKDSAIAAKYNNNNYGSMIGDTGAGTTTNSFGQKVDNNFAQGV